MSEGSFGPLDLSDANLKGFAPIDPGQYNAEVFEIKMDAVKNAGKMPIGTPMMKVQFKVFNPQFDGQVVDQDRRVFTQYVLPPNDYDKQKRDTMNGMVARFFISLGEDEKKVIGGKFNPDFEDFKGRSCVVVLGKEPKKDQQGNIIVGEYNNPVKGVKPAGTLAGSTSGGGLL